MKNFLKFLLVIGLPVNAYAQTVQECNPQDIITGEEYRPKGTDIPVYIQPNEKSEKLINEKLSKAINETRYIQFSNEYKVKEICHDAKNNWSLVKAVEPSYLSDTHYGWIKKSFLKAEKLDEKGYRIIEESDVSWNKKTQPYKELILKTLNKIHRENANCRRIDPSILDISSTKSSKSNPVFYVTCGEGLSAFNVFFSLSDMKNDKSQSLEYISQQEAISLCENDLNKKFATLKSVNFSKFLDVSYIKHPNGRVSLNSSVTLEDTQGKSAKYSVRCLFENNILLESIVDKF